MHSFELVVLRLIHVLSGAFWFGAMMMMAGFVGPAAGSVGPAAGPMMKALNERRLPTVMATVATLTILSGLRLMWILSSGFSSAWFATPTGRAFGWAGALAIATYVFGMFVARPAAVRVGALASALADATPEERGRIGAELGRLRTRSTVAGTIAATALLLATAGMAIARYV